MSMLDTRGPSWTRGCMAQDMISDRPFADAVGPRTALMYIVQQPSCVARRRPTRPARICVVASRISCIFCLSLTLDSSLFIDRTRLLPRPTATCRDLPARDYYIRRNPNRLDSKHQPAYAFFAATATATAVAVAVAVPLPLPLQARSSSCSRSRILSLSHSSVERAMSAAH
ncbi:hypothetical protein E4U54_001291 [Claviceps lovelessii]|nr:hypothetical protein E4U54_001291 [Claviceps lovelessii]